MPQLTTRGAHASDAFIRHVGHDLRSSLNAVVAWGELVRSGQLPPEELTRAGDTIVRQVRQLSRRLGDVLDLWRLDVDAITLTPASSSVSAAVRSAVEASRLHFETRHVSRHYERRCAKARRRLRLHDLRRMRAGENVRIQRVGTEQECPLCVPF